MTTRFTLIGLGMETLIVHAPAWGAPNVSYRQQNSAFFASATNTEDRGYNVSRTTIYQP